MSIILRQHSDGCMWQKTNSNKLVKYTVCVKNIGHVSNSIVKVRLPLELRFKGNRENWGHECSQRSDHLLVYWPHLLYQLPSFSRKNGQRGAPSLITRSFSVTDIDLLHWLLLNKFWRRALISLLSQVPTQGESVIARREGADSQYEKWGSLMQNDVLQHHLELIRHK